MIRLHVVDDEVIQGTATQHSLHIVNELAAHGPVSGIKQDGLFIQQNIGVIADAVVQGMDILKQGQAVVVGTNPVQIVSDFTVIIHNNTSF